MAKHTQNKQKKMVQMDPADFAGFLYRIFFLLLAVITAVLSSIFFFIPDFSWFVRTFSESSWNYLFAHGSQKHFEMSIFVSISFLPIHFGVCELCFRLCFRLFNFIHVRTHRNWLKMNSESHIPAMHESHMYSNEHDYHGI